MRILAGCLLLVLLLAGAVRLVAHAAACCATSHTAAGSDDAVLAPLAEAAPPASIPNRGTVRGFVTLAGTAAQREAFRKGLPTVLPFAGMRNLRALPPVEDIQEQAGWRIGPRGGVANVIVYVMTADGKPMPLEREDLNPDEAGWPREVRIETPRYTFKPHVAVLFPEAGGKPTGQILRLRTTGNDAMAFKLDGPPPAINFIRLIPPGGEHVCTLTPQRMVYPLSCPIYPWMRAWIRVLDHPFAAVTDDDGRFEIRRVPTHVPLRIQAWNENVGWLTKGRRLGDPITVEAGQTTWRSFEIDPKDADR
jgi:hypothetical protein